MCPSVTVAAISSHPGSASKAQTRQWDKVLFSQGVALFALFIMQHVLGLLLLHEICIPREVSFITPILQVVKEGIYIGFRHILQITNKVVLSIGSPILTITHALPMLYT